MDFYDEVKKLWKKNIDKKTGLTHLQKQHLEVLTYLVKMAILDATALGKTDCSVEFDSNNTSNYNVKLNDSSGVNKELSYNARSSEIYRLLENQERKEICIKEIEKALGQEFTVKVFSQHLYLSVLMSVFVRWPKPEEVI